MKKMLRDNGLSIAVFLLFAFSFIGQTITGHHVYNEDHREHHQPEVSYVRYFTTGHFVEALFENWESEFLQMGAYVLLTVILYQKGSAESKDPEEKPEEKKTPGSPAPIWKGGIVAKAYENSISLALLLLFLVSFFLHAAGGAKEYSEEEVAHGGQSVSMIGFMGTSQFWFESFQNWQSEFFSIGVLVVLTIFLRQKGSPQSKEVGAPNSQTGD